jgi:hypothetical protein
MADENFMQQHRQWITPLLRQRSRFSHAGKMSIFDFHQNGSVNENVFVFSILSEGYRSLIIFNNSNQTITGKIIFGLNSDKDTVTSRDKSLNNFLELNGVTSIQFAELRTGEKLRFNIEVLKYSGMTLSLKPYQLLVYDID